MKTQSKTDRNGNYIGNGDFHSNYKVIDFDGIDNIITSVSKSETTESVYVTYSNILNSKSITVRFSEHDNNAVKFGDQLNGFFASKNEILYKLDLITRFFVPATRIYIGSQQVKKSTIALYEVADLTIQEMYLLPVNSDLSSFKGKLAKDSNRLILGEKVELLEETSTNCFGESVRVGTYEYI